MTTTNVLFSASQIDERIQSLASEIQRDYPEGDEIHLVAVLKGGFMFMADLVRAMSAHVTLDFMAVSSYGKGTKSSARCGSSRTSTAVSRAGMSSSWKTSWTPA